MGRALRTTANRSRPRTGDPIEENRFMSDQALRIRHLSVSEWGEDKAVEMIGTSPCFREVQTKLEKISRYDEPVLVTGESGVGKEHLAQALYLLSGRRGSPYIAVNCPQYQEGNLSVSELFGHRKGSFTGAIADRKGVFETADGGVIFLDEIGDLHMSAQSMLLRALATGEFKPIGVDHARSADVRVVAATNRSLDELMEAQGFRNDLFFRLRYFLLTVPPLRERGDDWRLILDHVLAKLRQKYGVAKRFSSASLRVLEKYSWPGNIRELLSVATTGYAMADGDTIEPDEFSAQVDLPNDEREELTGDLYHRFVTDGGEFWEVIYRPFMERDLNRAQVKDVIKKGLREGQGSYQRLMDILSIPASEYQKFMAFLRHHNLKP